MLLNSILDDMLPYTISDRHFMLLVELGTVLLIMMTSGILPLMGSHGLLVAQHHLVIVQNLHSLQVNSIYLSLLVFGIIFVTMMFIVLMALLGRLQLR
jgi:hypothetical protein